jgi:hypothetical protein
VGEVRKPPVIANAPALCVLASLAVTLTEPLSLPPALRIFSGVGVYQTSAPYSTLGSAVPMYNFLAYFGVLPGLFHTFPRLMTADRKGALLP